MGTDAQETTEWLSDEERQHDIDIELAMVQYRLKAGAQDPYAYMAKQVALARFIRKTGSTPVGRQRLQSWATKGFRSLWCRYLFKDIDPIKYEHWAVYSALIPFAALVEKEVGKIPSEHVHLLTTYAMFEEIDKIERKEGITENLGDFGESLKSFADAREDLRTHGYCEEVGAVEALFRKPSKEMKAVVQGVLGPAFCETGLYEHVKACATDDPQSEKVYNYLWHVLLHQLCGGQTKILSSREPDLMSYLRHESGVDWSAFHGYLAQQRNAPGYRGEAARQALTAIRMSLTPTFVRNRQVRLGYRKTAQKGSRPERKTVGALSELAVKALFQRYGCSVVIRREPKMYMVSGRQPVFTFMDVACPQAQSEASFAAWRHYETKEFLYREECRKLGMDKVPYIPLKTVKAVFDDLGLRWRGLEPPGQ